MNHFPGAHTASIFITAAVTIDIWDESHAGDVAAARCTLAEILSTEYWEHPMLDDFHRTLVRVSASLLEDATLKAHLVRALEERYDPAQADDLVHIAHGRYKECTKVTESEHILPALRVLLGGLLDDSFVRNPENRELALGLCLAMSREFMTQHQGERHMRHLHAWVFHQESRGFSDPFDRYSNTGRCH